MMAQVGEWRQEERQTERVSVLSNCHVCDKKALVFKLTLSSFNLAIALTVKG